MVLVELPPAMEVLVISVLVNGAASGPVPTCHGLAGRTSLPDCSFSPGPERGRLEPNGADPVDNLQPI